MKMKMLTSLLGAICLLHMSSIAWADLPPGVVSSEIIFDNATSSIIPRRLYFSTFAETANYLIASCDGESDSVPQLSIKRYSKANQTWSAPVSIPLVSNNIPVSGLYFPALFQLPNGGPLLLFYQIDNTVSNWPNELSMMNWSTDEGATWNTPIQLPVTIGGPDRSSSLRLNSAGDLVVGSVVTQDGTSTANISVAHFDYAHPETLSNLASWTSVSTLQFGVAGGPAQYIASRMTSPSILAEGNNTFSGIGGMRTALTLTPSQLSLYQSQLTNGATTWTPLTQLSVGMRVGNRFVDAITLSTPINSDSGLSSKHAIAYLKLPDPNAVRQEPNLYLSLILGLSAGIGTNNQANNWLDMSTIETNYYGGSTPQNQFQFPNLFQTNDGMLHLTYRYITVQSQMLTNQIKHVVIDPTKLASSSTTK